MDRRKALETLAAIAGSATSAGIIGIGCGISGNNEKSVAREYKSGEAIEGLPVPVDVDGWSVYIDGGSMREYARKNPENSLEFFLIGRQSGDFPSIRSRYGALASYANRVERNGKNHWKMSAIPFSDYSSDVFLVFKQKKGEEAVSSAAFPLNLEVFAYREKHDRQRICSEVPLEERLLKEIHEEHKAFDNFTVPYITYIYKSEKELGMTDDFFEEKRGGVCMNNEARIYLPSIIFTNPKSANEGIIKMYHELAHVIMHRVINDDSDQRLNIATFNAYAALVEAAGYEIPMPTFNLLGPSEEVETNPCFSIFDESNYLKGKVDRRFIQGYGHPYSSHNEMFASAIAVFRFFPDEFTSLYQNLNAPAKKAVRNAARTVLSIVETINPNEDKLRLLLPEYELLKSELK